MFGGAFLLRMRRIRCVFHSISVTEHGIGKSLGIIYPPDSLFACATFEITSLLFLLLFFLFKFSSSEFNALPSNVNYVAMIV